MGFDEKNMEENLEKRLEQFLNGEDSEKTTDEPENIADSTAESAETEQQDENLSMEDKINLAMHKIMMDTIGEVPEEEEEESKKEKRQRKKAERKRKRELKKEQKKHSGKKWKIIVTVCLVLLIGGVSAYGGYGYYNRERFFEGTQINHMDCSGMTVAEAEEMIRNSVENYQITLKFRNDQTETIAGKTISYQYVSDGSIQKIKDQQNPWFWIKGYFEKKEYEVAENISYDEEKLHGELAKLSPLQQSNMEAPQDAYIFFENGTFVVKDEINGTTIDTAKTEQIVEDAISSSQSEVDLDEMKVYAEPKVKKDDPLLETQKTQLNNLVGASITYQLPNNQTLVLDGNLMKEWLTKEDSGNYVKNEEVFQQHLSTFISDMAEKYNTYGKDRKFKGTGIGEVTISGKYGWKIDQKKELETLKANIQNHEVITREPEYSSREISTENYGFGNTYVEVDLSRQHVWAYVNGELKVSSDCVSGKMVKSRWTPPGIFYLTYKQRDKTLKGQIGPDGKPEYESFVNYWMPFNGGIGFHDADGWRGSYGGTIYKYGGSHGCINMPKSKAAQLYEIINKEMPIIVYYSEPYTVSQG